MIVYVGSVLVLPETVIILKAEGQVRQDTPHQIGRGVHRVFQSASILPAKRIGFRIIRHGRGTEFVRSVVLIAGKASPVVAQF